MRKKGIHVIFLAILFIIFPLYAVYSEKSSIQLARKPFLLWFIGGMILDALLGGLLTPMLASSLALVVNFFVIQKIVQRARALGWRKEICYVCVLPIGILILGLILAIKGRK